MEQIPSNLPNNFYELPPAQRVMIWNRILSAIRQNTSEIKSEEAARVDYEQFANFFAGNETDFNLLEVEIDFNNMRCEVDLNGST